MSQQGVIDATAVNPEIPTSFITDAGTAVPIANELEILGVGSIGTTGVANIVSIQIEGQTAYAPICGATTPTGTLQYANTDQNNVGYVLTSTGNASIPTWQPVSSTGAVDSFAMQTGTSPVLPDGTGLVTFNGAVVPSGTNPVRTDGTGANTMALEIQISQAVPAPDATKIGLSNFDSTKFTVDTDGFVSTNGSGVGQTITGQSGGALSPTLGNWNIYGAVVAAGTTPIATSGAVSTLTVNVQTSQAIAATDATRIGMAAFDSAAFDVDANGFVQLNGGGIAATSFNVDTSTPPGTDPVVPNASGQISVSGGQVAAGTVGANVIRTDSLAANTFTIEVQRSDVNATTDSSKNGVCHFASADFDIDANGFVTLDGSVAQTYTCDSGSATPSASNINVFGATGGVNWRTSGSGATITGRSDILNITAPGAYPYDALDSDYVIAVDTSAARTIRLPNAPTTGKSYVIKDAAGSATTNNITLTTVGGAVTIDGSTSRIIASNYASLNVYFNGTSYFIW